MLHLTFIHISLKPITGFSHIFFNILCHIIVQVISIPVKLRCWYMTGNQIDIKTFLTFSSLFCSVIYFLRPFSYSFLASKLNKPLPIPWSTKYYLNEGDGNNFLFCAITWWVLYRFIELIIFGCCICGGPTRRIYSGMLLSSGSTNASWLMNKKQFPELGMFWLLLHL